MRQTIGKCGLTRLIIKLVTTNDRGLRIGESHQNAKYPDSVVDRIREMHEDEGVPAIEVSKIMGIPYRTVRSILDYERRAQTASGWKSVSVEVAD